MSLKQVSSAWWPDATYVKVPMADGGEGTVDSLVAATGGSLVTREVGSSPMGEKVQATYGLLGELQMAVIEIHVIEAGPRASRRRCPSKSPRITVEGKLDVDVLTAERVTQVTDDAVLTASDKRIDADLTVWASGITAPGASSARSGCRSASRARSWSVPRCKPRPIRTSSRSATAPAARGRSSDRVPPRAQ